MAVLPEGELTLYIPPHSQPLTPGAGVAAAISTPQTRPFYVLCQNATNVQIWRKQSGRYGGSISVVSERDLEFMSGLKSSNVLYLTWRHHWAMYTIRWRIIYCQTDCETESFQIENDWGGYQKVSSDCEVYGLTKHGLTGSVPKKKLRSICVCLNKTKGAFIIRPITFLPDPRSVPIFS